MNLLAITGPWGKLRERLSLAWQFAIVGALVVVLGMGIIGLWVTTRIEEAAVRNAANATALYVDGVIAPLTKELASSPTLGEGAQQALTKTLKQGALSRRLFSFKIWRSDGTIIFSNEASLVGKHFRMTDGLSTALTGSVHANFNDLKGDENVVEQHSGQPLLEIYSPIREPLSGNIIAVAEFYERATDLGQDLTRARLESWLVVALMTAGMLAALYGIVARSSHLIKLQRRALDQRVKELSDMLDVNRRLRSRIEKATQRTAALNERYLRRISAELHDGPAQLLGFAALRLDAINKGQGKGDDEGLVKSSITEAIQDIRNICRGLMLPELGGLTGENVVRRAISAHESRARAKVDARVGRLDLVSHASKICIYRFIQETLSNATRHAGASRITVSAGQTAANVVIAVVDDGAGFVPDADGEGLGLAGLEERLAGLGGSLEIRSAPAAGTVITMTLPREAWNE